MDRIAAGGSVGHVAGVAEAFVRLGHRLFFVSPFELLGIDTQKTPLYTLRPRPWWRDSPIDFLELSFNKVDKRLASIVAR